MPIEFEDVVSFLRGMKLTLQNSSLRNPSWAISTVRDKNLQTLADLELNHDDVKEILMSLTPSDYCQGPMKDSGIKGDLWVFGKEVKKRELYIKLKLWGDEHNQQLRVLSFHLAERALRYPF